MRQDRFIVLKECVIQYVVQTIPYFAHVGFIYGCILILAINCIVITIKLQQMKSVALGTKTGTQDKDQKLTQATWMTLKLFLLCVVPLPSLGQRHSSYNNLIQ